MNIFQAIGLYNRANKAIKKSKKLIDSKKDLAEKVRKHIDNILSEFKELSSVLPDLRNVYLEIVTIIEEMR